MKTILLLYFVFFTVTITEAAKVHLNQLVLDWDGNKGEVQLDSASFQNTSFRFEKKFTRIDLMAPSSHELNLFDPSSDLTLFIKNILGGDEASIHAPLLFISPEKSQINLTSLNFDGTKISKGFAACQQTSNATNQTFFIDELLMSCQQSAKLNADTLQISGNNFKNISATINQNNLVLNIALSDMGGIKARITGDFQYSNSFIYLKIIKASAGIISLKSKLLSELKKKETNNFKLNGDTLEIKIR